MLFLLLRLLLVPLLLYGTYVGWRASIRKEAKTEVLQEVVKEDKKDKKRAKKEADGVRKKAERKNRKHGNSPIPTRQDTEEERLEKSQNILDGAEDRLTL